MEFGELVLFDFWRKRVGLKLFRRVSRVIGFSRRLSVEAIARLAVDLIEYVSISSFFSFGFVSEYRFFCIDLIGIRNAG